MSVYTTISIHAGQADLTAARYSSGVALHVGHVLGENQTATLHIHGGRKTAVLAALAHWAEQVEALPDDEVTA